MNKDVTVKIIRAPYSNDKKWYMRILLDDIDSKELLAFEERYKKSHKVKSFQHSVYNNTLVVKIPFRYNKFECVVYDEDLHFCSCYDLKDDDMVIVALSHAGFSIQADDNILSSWKTKEIRKLSQN